ncbi:MAG TPA: hypothetical protein VJ782_05185 [Aeromicrobium sp.]|nr:hypothetical protein [Aeromicrobium sp.]
MSTRVDIEDVESTRSEKFLALVLAAFLLIGSIWFYVKVDDWIGGSRSWELTPAEQRVMHAQDDAWQAQEMAVARADRAETEVGLAKDALDIALAKGDPTGELEAKYQRELREFETARLAEDKARARAEDLGRQARAIEQKREQERLSASRQWAIAGVRLGFILGWFGASLRMVNVLRKRQSRFLPLAFAAVGTGVVTALVFATDYITDYIDPLDLGPIVLSVVGAAATIAAFVGLQRWLAARIPGRRVRNGECPFCGHPVRGDTPHCEGCGREVIAACASCSQPRRVGSPHCGACGNP